ncbi:MULTISPECIES: MlaD family protein [Asaia]|uniref:Toluene tolerance protein n=1 Tax=Asaia bogorensis TaxID=91915 RepID=A0A060QF38_9PROT|nr:MULTISPECIES: MlaD family protein [Asaia]ETC99758.1 organic solvent ABC transporter substrate-binding protein [Asaia sp. SF2.1]MDL2172384.1 MlaD family protein [Asaia sp. HumB]MDR6181952.1 phospholipid/cholesterol/gamma-HCH transport system substrate-binding protein [Asaia bogorensis NBRC 16594]NIE79988.1 MCE family protein [Asaia sp. As-1742]CDG39545.1 Putative toluene tolerance protein [Asaia bogorensis]
MAAKNRGGAILASTMVLAIAAGFAVFAVAQRHGPSGDTQKLHARFVSANGLDAGAAVVLAGVRVGTVQKISLDPATQMAQVDFSIDRHLSLPSDTILTIAAPTMTSENALAIEPGTSRERLPSDGTITNTQAPTSLEQQVSNYIFGSGIQ